jgi:hypothetical protein
MKSVIVIGAGPAGLASAINLAKKGYSVLVLEKNSKPGKKLLLTGNGKCNFWNADQDIRHYHSNSNKYKELITKDNLDKAWNFLNSLNFIYKEKDGYYYPNSNQSSTVLDCLLNRCKELDVEIKYDVDIQSVKHDDLFHVGEYSADMLVLACGSCAYPKTGSDGMGYKLAKELGHTIIPVEPALVQLVSKGFFLQNWAGVRQDVNVSLSIDDSIVASETGEIQLTNYGVSGICVFQLSNLAARAIRAKNKVQLIINYLPDCRRDDISKLISNNSSIINILSSMVNKKLANVIIELGKITPSTMGSDLNDTQKELLLDLLFAFKLDIVETKGFDNAQTVSGGIDLNEINISNMESKLVKDLYFAGEIIDCYGDCGGYNLSLAWITACIVGDKVDKG